MNTRKVFLFTGQLVAGVGMLVILGWIFDSRVLMSVIPGYVSMKLNTAVCFVLSGLSFWLIQINTRGARSISIALAFLTFLIGGISFAEYITGINVGIDEFFIIDKEAHITNYAAPGRMAISTSLSFILLGLALIGIKNSRNSIRRLSQYALHFITVVATLAIFGYVFALPDLYMLSTLTSMALHTSVLFFALSLVASFQNPEFGITNIFVGNKISNVMARRLFPLMTVLVILLAWIQITARRSDLLSEEFAIGLYVIAFCFIGLFLIWHTSKLVNHIDKKRSVAESKIIEINRSLEQTVENRTRELRLSENRFKGLLESAPDAIIIININSNIELINAQAEKLFGYKRSELIGKPVEILVPDDANHSRTRFRENYLTNLQTRSIGGLVDLFCLKKDGTQIPVEVSLRPLTTPHETLISAAIRDISERLKREQQLKKANEQLETLTKTLSSRNKQLADFAHIASHNLRAPVANLTGLLDLYKRATADEERNQYFEKFEVVIHHLETTLNGLLESIQKNETDAEMVELVSFEETFKKAKEMVMGEIDRSGSIVTSDFSQANEIIYNRKYLESIFLNLLSNSLKYRSQKRTCHIHFETKVSDGKIVLSASDNGLGIDMDKHGELLFGLNQTFHPEADADAKGVGLYLTKNQIEAMGGSISVSSEVDKGTVFSITFNQI